MHMSITWQDFSVSLQSHVLGYVTMLEGQIEIYPEGKILGKSLFHLQRLLFKHYKS